MKPTGNDERAFSFLQCINLDESFHLIGAQLRRGEPPRAARAQGLQIRGLAPAAQRAPRFAAAPPRGDRLRDVPGVDAERAAAAVPAAFSSRAHSEVH